MNTDRSLRFIQSQQDLIIPESVNYEGNDYTVTTIGECAFLYCFYLTNLSIPNTVTTIEASAFAYCQGFTGDLVIPNSVTTVGYGDITPVTAIGRLLSAFVMLLGYTIIAVPTGIVTANIIDETKEKPKDGHCPRCDALVRDEDRYCSHCGEKL